MLRLYRILRNRHKAYGACTVDGSLLGWRASKGSNGIAFTRWSRHCTAVTPAPVRPYKAPEVDQLIVHPPYNTPALQTTLPDHIVGERPPSRLSAEVASDQLHETLSVPFTSLQHLGHGPMLEVSLKPSSSQPHLTLSSTPRIALSVGSKVGPVLLPHLTHTHTYLMIKEQYAIYSLYGSWLYSHNIIQE